MHLVTMMMATSVDAASELCTIGVRIPQMRALRSGKVGFTTLRLL